MSAKIKANNFDSIFLQHKDYLDNNRPLKANLETSSESTIRTLFSRRLIKLMGRPI